MPTRIQLLGSPEIRNEAGEPQRIRGNKPWALLARVLLADRPLGRRQLAAELFPEVDDPLGSLRWCLAELRRAVGSADAFSGDPVVANLPAGTDVDVTALTAGGEVRVDRVGTLLEGVEPRSGPEFESWLLVERERTAALADGHIRQALLQALSLGHHERAMDLGRLAVARRPYDESAHVLLVKALSAAGAGEAAEQHVSATEKLFRTELGAEPSAALRNAARPTVAAPVPGVPAQAVASALLEAGLAALDAGAVDAGMECLRRATAEAERSRDEHMHATALLELGTALVHAVRGYDDEGAVHLRRASDLARAASDPAIAARALRELGYIDALVGRRPTASRYLDDAAALAGDDPELMAGIRAVTGFNLAEWGRYAVGLEHFEESIDLARSAGKPRREAWSLGLGARARLLSGDDAGAEAWLRSCLDLVRAEQWVAFRPWPAALLGEVELRRGRDPLEVRAGLEPTFALSCQLGDPCWEGSSARVIAMTHVAAGDVPVALEWIGEARRRCTRETDSYAGMEASILATEAELALEASDPVRSEAAARALLTLAAHRHLDGFVDHALGLLRTGPSTTIAAAG